MKKVRKINENVLRTGDIVFTSSNFPMGWITKRVTDSDVTHVGVVGYIDGTPHIFEMVGDFKRNDSDLEYNRLSKYTKWWKPWETLYSIKRSPVFDSAKVRNRFTEDLCIAALKGIRYDFPELLSFISKRKDKHPNRLICSGFVYHKTINAGVVWEDYAERGYAPSPAELYNDPCIHEVEGWKLK